MTSVVSRVVARKVKLSAVSAVAVAAVTLVSGCGMHPGAAAVVGDQRISTEAVDDAASALCSSTVSAARAQGQPRPDLPARSARQAALQLLMENELSRQFAEDAGIDVDQQAVAEALSSSAAQIDLLPPADRGEFRALFRGYQESLSILDQAGRESLAAQGNVAPSPEEASAEGARLRQEWAARLDIEVDPRFGAYANGTLTPRNGSLSIPASDRARQGASEEPGAAWTAALPPSQKC